MILYTTWRDTTVNIAKTTRAIRDQPERALPLLGITNNPDTQGT
ncbi:hypothetical protein ACFW2Y_28950 [Streptomyces sp. NPDC058877]